MSRSRIARLLSGLRRLAGFGLLLALIVGAVGYYQQRDMPRTLAPPLAAALMNGHTVNLGEMSARGPVLIYFWATWCPYCRVVSPAISELAGEHQVISIAMQSGDDTEVRAYLRDKGLHFPTINDPDGALSRRWGLRVTPTIVIVDSAGRIRWITSGLTSSWGLRLRLALTD